MKKSILTIVVIVFSMLAFGCTANQNAKQFGGTVTYRVSKSEKLVNLTWKDENLWILTRPRAANEMPQTFTFKEKSSFGIAEGTVVIVEE